MLLNIIQVNNIELYLMIRLIQRLLKYTSIKHIDYQLLIDSLGTLREIAKKKLNEQSRKTEKHLSMFNIVHIIDTCR
ncbi:unnamed protein product [Rotaria sordida]|uniref:Uncharacterized protein n=1 Tax=Rotaria sordida TaxID=392033 RepID=A0A815TH44_9BILA|nr:unnamed protein product [Rotaria sordida]CAF1508426.1 unnamed protein product [Rotaria sordida]